MKFNTAFEAVEDVLAQSGDTHPGTFLDILNENGFRVVKMPEGAYQLDGQWWFRDENDELVLFEPNP